MFNRLLWLGVGFIFLVPIHLHAQYQIIEIEKAQLATSLAAVVTDITGTRMPGVLVEEFSSDWKQSLRSTKTDAKGRFTLAPVKGRDVYYLQLTMDGFDPLRVRVKIDPKKGKNPRIFGLSWKSQHSLQRWSLWPSTHLSGNPVSQALFNRIACGQG